VKGWVLKKTSAPKVKVEVNKYPINSFKFTPFYLLSHGHAQGFNKSRKEIVFPRVFWIALIRPVSQLPFLKQEREKHLSIY
jgi:hypothetical protein